MSKLMQDNHVHMPPLLYCSRAELIVFLFSQFLVLLDQTSYYPDLWRFVSTTYRHVCVYMF